MDVKTFCDSLRVELTGWKAKTYDLVRKLEKMSGEERERADQELKNLHGLIDQISEQIETLEKECPVDWSPEKKELEKGISELEKKWETLAEMSPDDFE
jgi:predicted nuclease with TOPRIM domain